MYHVFDRIAKFDGIDDHYVGDELTWITCFHTIDEAMDYAVKRRDAERDSYYPGEYGVLVKGDDGQSYRAPLAR